MDRKIPDARGFHRVLVPEMFYFKSNRTAMVPNGQEITGSRKKWQNDLSQLGMQGKVSWDSQRRWKQGVAKEKSIYRGGFIERVWVEFTGGVEPDGEDTEGWQRARVHFPETVARVVPQRLGGKQMSMILRAY